MTRRTPEQNCWTRLRDRLGRDPTPAEALESCLREFLARQTGCVPTDAEVNFYLRKGN